MSHQISPAPRTRNETVSIQLRARRERGSNNKKMKRKNNSQNIGHNTMKNTHNHIAVINLYKQTTEALTRSFGGIAMCVRYCVGWATALRSSHSRYRNTWISVYGLENFNNVYSHTYVLD